VSGSYLPRPRWQELCRPRSLGDHLKCPHSHEDPCYRPQHGSQAALSSALEVVRQCCSQGDEVLVVAMLEGELSEATGRPVRKPKLFPRLALFGTSLGARLKTF
jgi:hypothetical protein